MTRNSVVQSSSREPSCADLIFGYYEPSDRQRWSAQLGSREELWTTLFLVMRALRVIKPAVWHTPESHRAAMAEETRQCEEFSARRKAAAP